MNEYQTLAIIIGAVCTIGAGVVVLIVTIIRRAWADWQRLNEFRARDAWKGEWH